VHAEPLPQPPVDAASTRLRDVGAVPLAAGGEIRCGQAFRISGQIVTPEQLEALRLAGVEVVVDLRGDDEDRSVVRDWAVGLGLRYRHEPIPAASGTQLVDRVRGGADPHEVDEVMRGIYRWIPDHHGEQITATLSVIAEGTITGFGCAAGRDRTGVVTALLQALLGADDEAIAAAYARDAPLPERLRPHMHEFFGLAEGDALPRAAEVLLAAREEWILEMLDHIRREHGGVTPYVRNHGLSGEAVQELHRLLVVRR